MEIISGRIQKPLKVVIYGPEGIGKTTFAAAAPNPLFCDIEASTVHMDVRRLPRPTSYQMVLDQIAWVKQNPGCCDTFVVDTADWLEKLVRENVCAKYQKNGIEDFGYGKGFTYVYEDFGKLLNALDELTGCGINVIVTAHAALRKFEQPDEMGAYDRWELKLINAPRCSVANMLKEWADAVFFANYETIVVKNEDKKNRAQGGRRVMYTSHHPCWDAKNRFGLPDKLPLDFGQVAGLFYRRNVTPSAPAPNDRTGGTDSSTPLRSAQNNMIGGASEFPVITDPDPDIPFTGPDGEIPQALADLMRSSGVTEAEITAVVADKGYFPANMKITDYPVDFVQGVLIGAWEQVRNMIMQKRKEG